MRVYTQNIDDLEIAAGISSSKIVHCHGRLSSSTCCTCQSSFSGESIITAIKKRQIPYCSSCVNDLETPPIKGLIKPNITFFGEDISPKFYQLIERDINECDLLLVAGTSLKVEPVASIVRKARNVTKVMVNLDKIEGFDINLQGKCDDICSYINETQGWNRPNNHDATEWDVQYQNHVFKIRRNQL